MKKIIVSIREAVDDKLRYVCALLSPENRILIVCVLLLLGMVLNFYFMFSTIRNWNRMYKTENTHIRHIKAPAIKMKDLPEEPKNNPDYEKEEFNEQGG